jgi:hypothetical protein
MIRPGKIFIGRPVRLNINFSIDDVDVDPTDVTLDVMSPSAVKTTYTYDEGTVYRSSAGDYYCDVTPTEAGRWSFRWSSTGTTTTDAQEDYFLVQTSPFYADPYWDYTA